MTTPYKLCPRCRTGAELGAALCARCGHLYRTQFTVPATPPVLAPTICVRAAIPGKPKFKPFQIGCLSILALCALAWVSSCVQSVYDATPAGQQHQAEQLARIEQAGEGFWKSVRQSDPDGQLFIHYRLTDAHVGGVIWVTVSNQWFYMPQGVQDQTYEVLRRTWGQCLGESGSGPVILADVSGRQLR